MLVANYEVSHTRRNLLRILEKLNKGFTPSQEEKLHVEGILRRCRADSIEEALVKARLVPPSLVIAQAALESGWGNFKVFP